MIDTTKFHKIQKHGKQIFILKPENMLEKDKLTEMHKEIIQKHSISLPDRSSIISSLIQILTQGDYFKKKICPLNFYIIRTDIKNFFPSINKHKLYQKIVQAHTLDTDTLDTIKTFIFKSNVKGVPLGLPISTSLSELYLEQFDNDIKQTLKPYYYFRYVDDIIIINLFQSTADNKKIEEIEKSKKKLLKIFQSHGLIINKKKTEIATFDSKNNNDNFAFTYLGYHFYSENLKSNKKRPDKILKIDISDKKYNKKIHSRLYYYFNKYNNSLKNNNDFWILNYQLMNLIIGTTSRKNKGNMTYGLAHSYKFINTPEHLHKLIKTFDYLVIKSDLSNKQRHTLWSIVKKDSRGIPIQEPEILCLLNKKYNYNNLTTKQLYQICTRIKIPENQYILKDNFEIQKEIMYQLYKS